MKATRPALRYHGGKWVLAPWIISHFPQHRVYVEPFGGGASVLIRKPRAYAEIYNDLDSEVVTLFQVLRDPLQSAELVRLLSLTPFARDEFSLSYSDAVEPVEIARRLVVRSFMGFGSDGINRKVKTGFRANSNKSGTTPAHDWAKLPECLVAVAARFAAVIIENRPALEVCAQHDGPETLHYLDPPYMHETRSKKSLRGGSAYHGYTHELTASDHSAMLSAAQQLQGMVIISGYSTPLYDDALASWSRVEKAAFADGAQKRTEVLWLNAKASGHLTPCMFAKADAMRASA